VHSLIRAAAERALVSRSKRAPFVVKSPTTLRLALERSTQAERCTLMPDVKRISPRVVELTHADYAVLFNAFRGLLILADIHV
jgi:D-aminopeptidase